MADFWTMLQSMRNDPNAINEQYGIPNSTLNMARSAALGDVGMKMIALGQEMTPGQRAQMMGNMQSPVGGYMEAINQGQRNAMLQRKMQMEQGQIESEQAGRSALMESIKQRIARNPQDAAARRAAGFLMAGDMTKAAEALYPEGIGAGDTFRDESDLRKEFNKLTGTFQEVTQSFGKIRSVGMSDPSPAGDMALVFNFMKMLDPGSAVRETEYANAENAAGVPERVRTMWNKLQSGEILGPDQRRDFVSRAQELYKSQLQQFNRERQRYQGIIQRDPRLNEENILYSPDPSYVEPIANPRLNKGDPIPWRRAD